MKYDIMACYEDEPAKQCADRIESYYPSATLGETEVLRGILEDYLGRKGVDSARSSAAMASLSHNFSWAKSAVDGEVRNESGRALSTVYFGVGKLQVSEGIKRYLATKQAIAKGGIRYKLVGVVFNGDAAIGVVEFLNTLQPSTTSVREYFKKLGYKNVGFDAGDFAIEDYGLVSPDLMFRVAPEYRTVYYVGIRRYVQV